MKFYHYRQNNTGGSFVRNHNLDVHVFIQAPSYTIANELARNIGIYFYGTGKGIDCNCCGDRWYEADSYDEGFDIVEFNKWVKKEETIIHYFNPNIGTLSKEPIIQSEVIVLPKQDHRRLELPQ